MTLTAEPAERTPPVPAPRLRVWREVLYILVVYLIYSSVRNRFGSSAGDPTEAARIAYGHALDVIRFEETLRLFFEEDLQRWYLGLPGQGWIQVWNVFYGTAHFIVTGGALLWLYLRRRELYPRMRNTLLFTTVLALVGFATFALMPPRLLNETPDRFGPPASVDHQYEFVDTLATYPTFWSFDSGGLKVVSNQYAAMPSLHTGWSVWSAMALYGMVRSRWAKALVIAHPIATVFCIMVTGNHYWIDAAVGLITLGVGYGAATMATRWWTSRQLAHSTAPAPAAG